MNEKMGIEGEGPKIIGVFVLVLIMAYFLDKNYYSSLVISDSIKLIRNIALVWSAVGVVFWIWSVALLLINFPKGKLIKTGPYAVFLHPLYNSFSFFILPALALYLNSWIYFLAPVSLFICTIIFGKKEEAFLAKTFGQEYAHYRNKVWFKF